jgi:O-antigen/teichoic acid export membrane protein
MGLLALLTTAAVAVGVPLAGPLGAAGATAAAEALTLAVLVTVLARRRARVPA